jgi:Tfp pilus assembly protein PilX
MKPYSSNQGFALPVAIAVGLLVSLLGLFMVTRATQTRFGATAQKSSTRSLAAAEAGLAQIQSLLKRYRSLALHCSRSDIGCAVNPVTWQTMTYGRVDACYPTPGESVALVQNYASRAWQALGTAKADGEFRLISYQYTPTPGGAANVVGQGALVVEGRVDANADDSTSFRTSTARLRVTFNVMDKPGLETPPGLWIKAASTAASSVTLNTNVRDANCADESPTIEARVQSPYTYQSEPGDDFPQLPAAGDAAPELSAPGVHELPTLDGSTLALPRSGADTPHNKVLTYYVRETKGRSINLSKSPNATLNIGSGAETVVLHLEGGMTIDNGNRIQVADGVKLIIYAHGPITLANNANPALAHATTPGVPSNIQLYSYTPDDITLSGSLPLSFFLFAPRARVITTVPVQGNLWAKSIESSGAAILTQSVLDPTTLNLVWPLRVDPLTSWRPEEIPLDGSP